MNIPTLVEISPICRKELYQKLVRRRSRRVRSEAVRNTESRVQVIDMHGDSEVPTISVEIERHMIPGVQLDGGAAVSLITDNARSRVGI